MNTCIAFEDVLPLYETQLVHQQSTTCFPPRLLMYVFRCVSPDGRRSITCTHVCRLWRSIIHAVSEFWVKLLDPDVIGVLTSDDEQHGPIISEIVRRSSPLTFGIGMTHDCVRLVKDGRVVDDLSRLSTLCLISPDYPSLGDGFEDILLPSLDKLSIWCAKHSFDNAPKVDGPLASRLRSFQTNCMTLVNHFVGLQLRELSVGCAAPSTVRRTCGASFTSCCNKYANEDLLYTLQRCPALEVLRLSECLPLFNPNDSES
ncbi:hypothetical protein L226DRAFT_207499 [Lentinus tigrinus ALCF2SS1-7]|uniref:uncharacterized protein n=1 Tax=Lentinus tigrinus ALCF2SS1-7 TaxID=1328758 RepID=UPI0011663E3F|nr:hypothetical protein L226DRAFT_207499 [Lentinus tigrinus ALCF2SS1-7]